MPDNAHDRDLDLLLELLGRQRFLIHEFGADHDGPAVLAAVRNWGGAADGAILFDESRAGAHRLLTGAGVDVFAPREVQWWYAACPVWTLRAIPALPAPGHPGAPSGRLIPPAGYALPGTGRTPVRVRGR